MQKQHLTDDPAIFTAVAALIFIFTSLLFLLYDWFSARRQRLVTRRAVASGAIVSSLYPQQVRDRIYEETEAETDQPMGILQFSARREGVMDSTNRRARPNAQLYPHTSIFFADLVGFTAWSGTRTPEQVFELLEGIYAEFDKLAARRKVFKIETIGDCYVAATGIPEPQPRHATIMVRFAKDCLDSFPVVTSALSESLGQDTMNLSMRVGIHSGATTAGVLRGDKGRFQIFGDTVNTASRMESNGVKSKIQVSQATADELLEAGKEDWLVAREELVSAKGKGDMQTYFVVIPEQRSTTLSSSSTSVRGSTGSIMHSDLETGDVNREQEQS